MSGSVFNSTHLYHITGYSSMPEGNDNASMPNNTHYTYKQPAFIQWWDGIDAFMHFKQGQYRWKTRWQTMCLHSLWLSVWLRACCWVQLRWFFLDNGINDAVFHHICCTCHEIVFITVRASDIDIIQWWLIHFLIKRLVTWINIKNSQHL